MINLTTNEAMLETLINDLFDMYNPASLEHNSLTVDWVLMLWMKCRWIIEDGVLLLLRCDSYLAITIYLSMRQKAEIEICRHAWNYHLLKYFMH